MAKLHHEAHLQRQLLPERLHAVHRQMLRLHSVPASVVLSGKVLPIATAHVLHHAATQATNQAHALAVAVTEVLHARAAHAVLHEAVAVVAVEATKIKYCH